MLGTEATIARIVKYIAEKQTPTLVLDTCALLDIIRLPYGAKDKDQAQQYFNSARILLQCAEESRLTFVLPPCVKVEFEKNLYSEVDRLKEHTEKVVINLTKINALIPDLEITRKFKEAIKVNLPDLLEALVNDIVKSSIYTAIDRDILLSAHNRTMVVDPPAKKGKDQNDCINYLHSLEVFRQLHGNSCRSKCVFLTSNTSDFCDSNKVTPKAKIKSELDAINATLVTQWAWAHNELGF